MYDRLNWVPSGSGLVALSTSCVPIMTDWECERVLQDPRVQARIRQEVERRLNDPDNLPLAEEAV